MKIIDRLRLLPVNWSPEAGSEARVWGVAQEEPIRKGGRKGVLITGRPAGAAGVAERSGG